MKHGGLAAAILAILILHGETARAQSSLQALEQELNDAKQQHEEVASKALSAFFSQVDAAMADPNTAVSLYQQAGGTLPTPTPVTTEHVDETFSEKQAREAADQNNLSMLGAVLQMQCGMMHYAALFVVKPAQTGLQDDWVAWLKKEAPVYPQIAPPPVVPTPAPSPQSGKKENRQNGKPAATRQPPFSVSDLKSKAMRETLISKFLAFKAWDDKEQGGWALRDLPRLYRANVLDPLRAAPSAATLVAWDVYIAMLNSDEPDNDKWTQTDYPPLQFERGCDAYAVAPSTETLEKLVNLIKANPTYPGVDDWIARVHQLVEDYRSRHGGAPAAPAAVASPSAPAPEGSPNVTITQQGDATIITTHTNSAPVAPGH